MKPCECVQSDSMTIKPTVPARLRLKLLVVEADEETLDRIIEAIQFVCGSDSDIRQ